MNLTVDNTSIIVYNNAKVRKYKGEYIMQNRKVHINPQNNLLFLDEKIYPLVDVKEPNVFRNLFPYDEIP